MQQYYQIYFDKVTYNYVTSKVFQDLQGTLSLARLNLTLKSKLAGLPLQDSVMQDMLIQVGMQFF